MDIIQAEKPELNKWHGMIPAPGEDDVKNMFFDSAKSIILKLS